MDISYVVTLPIIGTVVLTVTSVTALAGNFSRGFSRDFSELSALNCFHLVFFCRVGPLGFALQALSQKRRRPGTSSLGLVSGQLLFLC